MKLHPGRGEGGGGKRTPGRVAAFFSSPIPAVLYLGIACQVTQIVLLRELLMTFYGNELSIGIIFASWMLWTGMGSGIGGLLAGKVKSPLLFVVFNATAFFLVLPLTIFGIRFFRGLFPVPGGVYVPFSTVVAFCLIALGPACLLLGSQFVFLSRLWRQRLGVSDTSGGVMTYIFEAIGSIIGGLAFTLVLVHFLSSLQTALLLGAAGLVVILALAKSLPPEEARRARAVRGLLLAALAAAVVLASFSGKLDRWATEVQWRLFNKDLEFVESRESRYGRISVLKNKEQYSFYQSSQFAFSTAGPREAAFEWEEQKASVFVNYALAQHKNPRTVLLIGGGLAGMLRELVRHPLEKIDYIELDPVLVEMARNYVPAETLAALSEPSVTLKTMDGRLYVKGARERYDLILIALPDPSTAVLNRFYTVEFFREAKRRLNPDGVLVTGVRSAQNMQGLELVNRNATVYHTLKRVFAHVLPAGETFTYFFATDAAGQLSWDEEVLRKRFLERGVETPGFSEWYYSILFQPSPLMRVNWILRHRGRSPADYREQPEIGPATTPSMDEMEREEARLPAVDERHFINSDLRPIGYYYTLLVWDILSRLRQEEALNWALYIQPWWIVPVLFLVIGLGLLFRISRWSVRRSVHMRYAILFAIFTTGLSTMTYQIVLIFSFQSIYGFVYEMIGLIVALFMGGLSIGSALSQRFVKDKGNVMVLALIELFVFLFACAMALSLLAASKLTSSTGIFLLFCGITLLAGIFDGADFPVATACYMKLSGSAERSTGLIYGVELIGGCVGAALTSVILVPVLGIIPACLFGGLMNAAAALVLVICRK